ncbi:MAG: CGNR zinc finger domain-containing protein, partial [Planctomycetota bacterium]
MSDYGMDELWLDLLNSDWHDYLGSGRTEDRLENLRWLQGFLARWNLPRPDASSRDTRRALRNLRSL